LGWYGLLGGGNGRVRSRIERTPNNKQSHDAQKKEKETPEQRFKIRNGVRSTNKNRKNKCK